MYWEKITCLICIVSGNNLWLIWQIQYFFQKIFIEIYKFMNMEFIKNYDFINIEQNHIFNIKKISLKHRCGFFDNT